LPSLEIVPHSDALLKGFLSDADIRMKSLMAASRGLSEAQVEGFVETHEGPLVPLTKDPSATAGKYPGALRLCDIQLDCCCCCCCCWASDAR
jgi:hypothetical protein